MDSYSPLLEKLRLPQPSLQKFAVMSIFQKLQSAPPYLNPDSDPGRNAITHCLHSNSPHIIEQSIRELCRFVKQNTLPPSRALLELQSALEGCSPSLVDLFLKGIGFIARFTFQNNILLNSHPFVSVLSGRSEVKTELVQQVLLFIVQNKSMGLDKVCGFLKPFLSFSILRIPFTDSGSSASFARELVSSVTILCCTFSCEEGLPILKLVMQCLKYFPCKDSRDLEDILYVAEYLVDAFIVVLKQCVEAGVMPIKSQLRGVELLGTLLSFYTDLDKNFGRKETIVELSKRLLLVQKELDLQYIPELSSLLTSMFLILTRTDFEHEQLSIMKISIFLLKWKYENESIVGRSAHSFIEELLIIFPVISLLSSPSGLVKTAATDFLAVLEKLLKDLLVAGEKVSISQQELQLQSISKPEFIICRLLRRLWFQEHHSELIDYFLSISFHGETENNGINREEKSWLSQLREYCFMIVERRKSQLVSHCQENLVTEVPLLLSSVVTVLVMHHSLGSFAVDLLATVGVMEPKLGFPLLLSVLFFNKIFRESEIDSQEILLKVLEMLPSLASQYAMAPLIVQTILPMLDKDAKPVLRATATRLLCKTWEVTDRVFESLQIFLDPTTFNKCFYDKDICISKAACVRDVCRKNPDKGVDLILSVSACIECKDPTVQAFGFQSLGYLCEADVVDFYTAWDVIEKHVLDYNVDPVVAHSLCILLRWGATDAEAYLEDSKRVLKILWDIGTSRRSGHEPKWVKTRASAFQSLAQYEVEHAQKSIPDFKRRNIELLVSEENPVVLKVVSEFEVKIIRFEHSTRRRLLKEKRITVNKVEKLVDVFPQVIFLSGKNRRSARDLPGAALLCLSFTPKDVQGQKNPKELPKLHSAYENALGEMAESLPLSRNMLFALLSQQSWKPFVQRWMKAVMIFLNAKVPTKAADVTSKAATDILKIMTRVAEESIPRSSENIALAISALCLVLPPSAHTVTAAASTFLLEWLFQFEHEHKQWSAAISLGLVSSCLHATDHRMKFQIISGLLEVACKSKSTLVKGACGVGLGFTSRDILIRAETPDVDSSGQTSHIKEVNLLGRIVKFFSRTICHLSPSSYASLQTLSKLFPSSTDDMIPDAMFDQPSDNCNNLEEDVWGVGGLVLGLGECTNAIYRAFGNDAATTMKTLLISWIPHVNSSHNSSVSSSTEIMLSVGSCLALPTVIAFCLRVELISKDEINDIINGYINLISELLSAKKSGALHQSLLTASCVGAGNLLSCILDEGVYSMKVEYVKNLLELFRKCYTDPYPSTIHFAGMLGVVNALGAGVGALTYNSPRHSSPGISHGHKESSYIRGPILSEPDCESLSTKLVQEIFLAAQDSGDQQLQKYAAWAVSFLRHRWWSNESPMVKNDSQRDSTSSKPVSQAFPEDSIVLQLCLWLRDLNYTKGSITHVNTVATVLRCLTQAPRLPSLEWGPIIRRCMIYEDQVSAQLSQDHALQKGVLREECVKFALTHANHVNDLLIFLDELADLSRFRTLELNLQSCLLYHLAELVSIFSGSRLEKLFDDMADYFSSDLYQVYKPDQKILLRTPFWKGLRNCSNENASESAAYLPKKEKCMELLFTFLPPLHLEANLPIDHEKSTTEWSEAIRCLGKARQGWLMDLLEVPQANVAQERLHLIEVVKKIQTKAKLVKIGCIPLRELVNLKAYMLNTRSDGIWDGLLEVISALQQAEGSVKRQWLVDAVEISCVTKYPTTALQFIGLLSGSFCKYMPLLVLDKVTVLCDLPVTVPSLLSDDNWMVIAEPVVLNLWRSTERVYNWTECLASGRACAPNEQSIDESESKMAGFITTVMYKTCMSLKDYLPLEKQLKLANMTLPDLDSYEPW